MDGSRDLIKRKSNFLPPDGIMLCAAQRGNKMAPTRCSQGKRLTCMGGRGEEGGNLAGCLLSPGICSSISKIQ